MLKLAPDSPKWWSYGNKPREWPKDRNAAVGISMGFCSVKDDVVSIISNLTSCKDYLTDALVFDEEGMGNAASWAYRASGKLEQDRLTLYMILPPQFTENVLLMQEYELSEGLDPVQVDEIEGCPDVYVLRADPWWMTTTLHLSAFLSMVRNIAVTKILGSMEEARGCGYTWRLLPNVYKLVSGLKHIEYVRRRNSPNIQTMHGLNGHYCFLTVNPVAREALTYTKQLMEIDPEIVLPRNDVGVIFPVQPDPVPEVQPLPAFTLGGV